MPEEPEEQKPETVEDAELESVQGGLDFIQQTKVSNNADPNQLEYPW